MRRQSRIPFVVTSLALLLLVWSGASSCNHATDTTSNSNDTIHLVSLQGAINLTNRTTVDSANLILTCGCKYRLNRLGNVGYTDAFSVTYLDDDTSFITPHHLLIQVRPSAAGNSHYLAFYNFDAVDHLGGTDSYTLQVSAQLP